LIVRSADWLTIFGGELTRIVVLAPELDPQFASVTDVIERSRLELAVTEREVEAFVMLFWVTPSDQTIVNGAVPVRVTGIVAAEPAQASTKSGIDADGAALIAADPVCVKMPLQIAPVLMLMVNETSQSIPPCR